MKKRKIKLRDSHFYVEDCDMAANYSDVTRMFLTLEDLGIAQDAVIFDVGANIGIFSMSYATIYSESTVYSFEPHPGIYKKLSANIDMNGQMKDRIHPFCLGLSDVTGPREICIPTADQHSRYDPGSNQINIGLFSMHGHGEDKVKCEFITLDEFCRTRGIDRIDLIKIDVEGHEFETLKGAEETIGKCKPVIYMEYNELTRTLSDHNSREYEQFFRQHGYSVNGIQYGWKRELKHLETLGDISDVSDLVCVRQ